MNTQDFLDLVDAYALDALEPGEKLRVERFLASDQVTGECLMALKRARRVVAGLSASLSPLRPAPHVWENIQREIGGKAVEQPEEPVEIPSNVVPLFRRVLPWCLAAAAACASLYVYHGRTRIEDRLTEITRESKGLRNDLGAIATLAEVPGARLVNLRPLTKGSHRGSLIVDQENQKAVFLGRGLQSDEEREYVLWVVRDRKWHAVGALAVAGDGTAVLSIEDKTLLRGGSEVAFCISIEPKSGKRAPKKNKILMSEREDWT